MLGQSSGIMMIPPLDHHAQTFDSADAERHPAPSAHDAPGFYLVDNANGRFVVDREMGVVSLADESILQSERNGVYGVRLRVIEPSGAAYELDMQLRITGRVPQMVGAEEFAPIAVLTDETILVAPRVPVLLVSNDAPVVAESAPPLASTPIIWTRFTAAQGHISRSPRQQPRRSFIAPDLPATNECVSLAFDGLPQAFSAHLPWSL